MRDLGGFTTPRNKKEKETATMQRVMIYPASYDDVRKAVDRAFELFPLPIQGKKFC